MHAIYQHFSELIEQAVIQLCPNLFLNFPAAAELQVTERRLFANKERVNNKVDNLQRTHRASSLSHDFRQYGTDIIGE